MIKIKNFLALLLVLFSVFSYAQLPKPAYVGSKSYSAKGSGSAGNIGTINYTIPTGVTNKNRVMIISFAGERYNPGPGLNLFRNLTNDYKDAISLWGISVNGNPVTNIAGWQSNTVAVTNAIQLYQDWGGVAYAYTMPDNMTGTVPITFSNFRTPANANDEIACVVSVYENVKSVELYSGAATNTPFGSIYTGTPRPIPAGRTAQEIMYIINGMTTHETDLTLSSGWTTDQFVKVTNKTTTASDAISTNEHDGIAHIIGHRNGFSATVSGGITKSSTVANTRDTQAFHALLPFVSPSVTGKVVTPTLSSSISTDGGGLYVNVVDKSTGKVVAVATVDASGNFTIPAGNVAEGMQYDYMLSKNIGTVGSAAPAVALNTGWTTVAEGEGPFVADTTPDGIFTMTMTGTNVGSMRFAIIPTIDAVNDAYTDVLRGNTTASVILNDLLSDSPATIGTTAGTVSISTVTDAAGTAGAWPAGFTLNANGTIAVGSAVTPGAYTLYYKICAQTAGAPCDVATVTITVNAPCTNSGVTSVNLNSMYTGTLPANVVLEWWTSADRLAPGVKVTNPTAVTVSGRYYVFFYDTVNLCYNTDLSTSYVDVSILPPCACTNNPATGGSNHDTKMGITLLKRAGAENADNWPMVRKSGHIALESNTQGFVVTRMTTAQLTAIKDANNAVEGMMSYDTDAKCLKIYDGTDWKCFSTPSCP